MELTTEFKTGRLIQNSRKWVFPKIGVGPPNHPILIGFSIINHPFWDTPIFGNTQIIPNQYDISSEPLANTQLLPCHICGIHSEARDVDLDTYILDDMQEGTIVISKLFRILSPERCRWHQKNQLRFLYCICIYIYIY